MPRHHEQVCYTIQDRQQVPAELDWLTAGERDRFDGFRFDKRRQDWLLGRWAAKLALLELADEPARDIRRFEIATAPDGAPMARIDGRPFGGQLSLSHSNGRALATVSRETTALGCDIELIEPRSDVFVETWFTESERAHVEKASPFARDSLVTTIWSAKESTLKALRTGLQADTRSVEVIFDGECAEEDWGVARTVAKELGEFNCLWRIDGDFVLTIASAS